MDVDKKDQSVAAGKTPSEVLMTHNALWHNNASDFYYLWWKSSTQKPL